MNKTSVEWRLRPEDLESEIELTFGLVLLRAAARLLRLGVYEVVIGMGTDVLSHP